MLTSAGRFAERARLSPARTRAERRAYRRSSATRAVLPVAAAVCMPTAGVVSTRAVVLGMSKPKRNDRDDAAADAPAVAGGVDAVGVPPSHGSGDASVLGALAPPSPGKVSVRVVSRVCVRAGSERAGRGAVRAATPVRGAARACCFAFSNLCSALRISLCLSHSVSFRSAAQLSLCLCLFRSAALSVSLCLSRSVSSTAQLSLSLCLSLRLRSHAPCLANAAAAILR